MIKRRIKYLILILTIILYSCHDSSKDNHPKYNEIPEVLIFKDQPEIRVNDSCFSIKAIIENIVELKRYRFRFENLGPVVSRYWMRCYSSYPVIFEIRYVDMIDWYDYIIALNSDGNAFYIKWKTKPNNTFANPYTNDIGKNTTYLETNLTPAIIKKYFPEINCNIIEKHPKSIQINMKDGNPATSFLLNKFNISVNQ